MDQKREWEAWIRGACVKCGTEARVCARARVSGRAHPFEAEPAAGGGAHDALRALHLMEIGLGAGLGLGRR